jgi:hypothetical protein
VHRRRPRPEVTVVLSQATCSRERIPVRRLSVRQLVVALAGVELLGYPVEDHGGGQLYPGVSYGRRLPGRDDRAVDEQCPLDGRRLGATTRALVVPVHPVEGAAIARRQVELTPDQSSPLPYLRHHRLLPNSSEYQEDTVGRDLLRIDTIETDLCASHRLPPPGMARMGSIVGVAALATAPTRPPSRRSSPPPACSSICP